MQSFLCYMWLNQLSCDLVNPFHIVNGIVPLSDLCDSMGMSGGDGSSGPPGSTAGGTCSMGGPPGPTPPLPPTSGASMEGAAIQPLASNVMGKQQPSSMEAQYMQQQSQIFVFSTTLANKSAEAVLQGQFPSIIAYHCSQPGTKKYLEVSFSLTSNTVKKVEIVVLRIMMIDNC